MLRLKETKEVKRRHLLQNAVLSSSSSPPPITEAHPLATGPTESSKDHSVPANRKHLHHQLLLMFYQGHCLKRNPIVSSLMAVLVKVRLSDVHQFTGIMQHRQRCVSVCVCVNPCFSSGTSASLKHLDHPAADASIPPRSCKCFCFDSLIFFKSAPI